MVGRAGARVASGSFQFPPGRGSQQSDDDRVRWMIGTWVLRTEMLKIGRGPSRQL